MRASRRTGGRPDSAGQLVEQPLAGQVVPERDAAGQVAGPRPDGDAVALDVVPEDGRAPGGRMEEAEEQADERRLAGAVGPEEAEDLALLDLDVEVGQGRSDPSRRAAAPGRSRAGQP